MTQMISFRWAIFCATLFGAASGGSNSVQAATKLDNACNLFQEKIGWRTITTEVSEKWGVPVSAILAIMHQESRFKSTAAAKTTTAFGFSQALDGTWKDYQAATNTNRARRTSLTDSADFIGWYMTETERKIGLPFHNVADHYLTYHEGHQGYQSRRWKKQPKLIQIAEDVAKRAAMYEEQLKRCRTLPEEILAGPVPEPIGKPFALAEVAANVPRRKPIGASFAFARIFPQGFRWPSFR